MKLNSLFKNQKNIKILITTFMVVVLSIIAFLIINLFKFYNQNIKPNKLPLYYEFKPNTVKDEYVDTEVLEGISEQFLSYKISYGIDVSEWQGVIDWESVRATGLSFAMIRCGYRQTVGSKIKEDAMFRTNIEGAIEAGLKVGVYFFGTAKNEEEALEEAEFTINLIKDYNLSYPVAYDTETFDSGRLQHVSYSTITDNVLTFTETVSSYGYDTMVYSYHNAFTYLLDMGKLDGKLIWLAHYTDSTNYKGNYNMWQYSDSGIVDGIKTNVDLNISYFTYVDSEDNIIENPDYVKEEDVYFEPVEENVITLRKTEFKSNPSNNIPNRLGYIPKGTHMIRTGTSENFSRVLYDNRTVYISNKDLKVP